MLTKQQRPLRRQRAVKLSPKFQVVIPLDVRQDMNLRPGQKLEVFEDDGVIVMVPLRPLKDMRGFLKGMNAAVKREKTDRL